MDDARVLAQGRARGIALVLDEPLSFWGGSDPGTGLITDRRHPQHGERMADRVLVMPSGRGSSSSSAVLAEAIRAGTAPAGIVLRHADPIVALGAVVAAELYGRSCPVAVAPGAVYDGIRSGDEVHLVAEDGRVTLTSRPGR